eukprot:1160010-Pelagomonas_calceolata.AAC.13
MHGRTRMQYAHAFPPSAFSERAVSSLQTRLSATQRPSPNATGRFLLLALASWVEWWRCCKQVVEAQSCTTIKRLVSFLPCFPGTQASAEAWMASLMVIMVTMGGDLLASLDMSSEVRMVSFLPCCSGTQGVGGHSRCCLLKCKWFPSFPVVLALKVSAGMNGKLANVIKEMCNNRSLNFDQHEQARKQVLIMDEVDGMSGACARVVAPHKRLCVYSMCGHGSLG